MIQHNSQLISNEFSIMSEKQNKLVFFIEQNENLSSSDVEELAVDVFNDIDSRLNIFSLSIADKDNIIQIRVNDGKITEEFVGTDTSHIPYVQELSEKKKIIVSPMFTGLDGNSRLVLASPIFDDMGNILGSVRTVLDPTGFFNQYDDFYHMPSDTLIVIDKNQDLVKHSIPELIGENIFGKKIQSRINSDNQNPEINEQMKKTFDGSFVSFDFQIDGITNLSFMNPVFLNGEQIFTVVHSVPVESIYFEASAILFGEKIVIFSIIIGTGFVVFFSIYFIQKQHLRREELQKLSAIGEVSARLAHDIRNPLSNINMAKEMLKKKLPDGKNQELLCSIETAISRISHQVDVVLSFVKSKPSVFKHESLTMILDAAIKNTKIPDRIKVERFSSSCVIQCDFLQLENAFTNLLVNAVQSIPKTGKITISVEKQVPFVKINIIDSGPGISENIKNKIFEPLFTTKEQGTGLGLVSCKTIIESHGGTISVKNNPTTFTIWLPIIKFDD